MSFLRIGEQAHPFACGVPGTKRSQLAAEASLGSVPCTVGGKKVQGVPSHSGHFRHNPICIRKYARSVGTSLRLCSSEDPAIHVALGPAAGCKLVYFDSQRLPKCASVPCHEDASNIDLCGHSGVFFSTSFGEEPKAALPPLPENLTLSRGFSFKKISVVRWLKESVVIRHVGGVEFIRYDRMRPADRKLFESHRDEGLCGTDQPPLRQR